MERMASIMSQLEGHHELLGVTPTEMPSTVYTLLLVPCRKPKDQTDGGNHKGNLGGTQNEFKPVVSRVAVALSNAARKAGSVVPFILGRDHLRSRGVENGEQRQPLLQRYPQGLSASSENHYLSTLAFSSHSHSCSSFQQATFRISALGRSRISGK